ncbi:MAG: winged helix-turn-helix domain-containing protein [Candidatus Altiarchaeota archaeon]|nr:winged helix-turn-helix domain-containing protein [Candidatus Altiarchaeota archaeon]
MQDWNTLKYVVEKGASSRKKDESTLEEVIGVESTSTIEKKLTGLVINKTDALILNELMVEGNISLKKLRKNVKKSRISIYHSLKKLEERGFIRKEKSNVKLEENKVTSMLRKLSSEGFSFSKLTGKRIRLLQSLTEWKSPDDLSTDLDISVSSSYKYISQLESVLDNKKNSYRIKRNKKTLLEFLEIIDEGGSMGSVELWLSQNEALIKTEEEYAGSLTSFSRFNEFGIDTSQIGSKYYHTPPRELRPEEILVHSIKSSENSEMLSYSIAFYLNNTELLNPLLIERLASRFGVLNLWMDIQSYISNNSRVKNKGMFIHRDEFSDRFGFDFRKYEENTGDEKIKLSDEVLFISKIISLNSVDVLECENLIKGKKLDWGVIKGLVSDSGNALMEPLIPRMEVVSERAGVNIPIIRDLRNAFLEEKIKNLLDEKRTVKGIHEILEIPEYQIRNILNKMSREYKIKKLNTKPLMYSNFLGLE